MLGNLNRKQIDTVLHSQVIGRIGCCVDGKVYVVPTTYAYDGTYLYGHTVEGQKIAMMRQNPNVCLEVDVVDTMAHWQSVIVWGKYEELKGQAAEDALQELVVRVQPLLTSETSRPRHGLERSGDIRPSQKTVIYRIKVEEATGRFERP